MVAPYLFHVKSYWWFVISHLQSSFATVNLFPLLVTLPSIMERASPPSTVAFQQYLSRSSKVKSDAQVLLLDLMELSVALFVQYFLFQMLTFV